MCSRIRNVFVTVQNLAHVQRAPHSGAQLPFQCRWHLEAQVTNYMMLQILMKQDHEVQRGGKIVCRYVCIYKTNYRLGFFYLQVQSPQIGLTTGSEPAVQG